MADNTLAELLALQGARALHNPIARYALGLASTDKGSYTKTPPVASGGSPGGTGNGPGVKQTPIGSQGKPSPEQSLQDKLLARMITVKDSGFAIPNGQGILPGVALRPEVRKAFEDAGGVVGIDITELSPEEERGLAMLLDPQWTSRRAQ